MTVDKEKLKALAEIMLRDIDGCLADSEACDFQQHVADYEELTQPGGVLALLEEIEQLRESHEQVCANYNRVSFASEERGKQVDQFKAENETLRKDAERYRWLSIDGNWVCRLFGKWRAHVGEFGVQTPTGWYTTRGEAIDAAIAKEASNG